MKCKLTAAFLFLLTVSCVQEPAVDTDKLFGHVLELASEEYAGRRAGTEGNRKAVEYIRGQFEMYGLESPAGIEGYTQSFEQLTLEMQSLPTLELIDREGEAVLSFVHLIDFRAIHHWTEIRTEGTVEAEIFLVNERDELYNLPQEADGRVVLVKRAVVKGMRVTALLEALRSSGLRIPALIIGYDARQKSGYYSFGTYTGWNNGVTDFDGPFIFHCIDEVYERLKRHAVNLSDGPDVTGGAPYKVRLIMNTRFPVVESSNVIAARQGGGEGALIISAHLDHVGRVGEDAYCPGALDNAGGVAVLLELARMVSRYRPQPEQTIVFIAFNGEEQDLFGSRHYVENPVYPLEQSACVNLDMVGSSGELPLTVSTVRSGNDITEGIIRILENDELDHERVTDAWNSDHASFARKGVPAVLLTHQDYTYLHTPLDKPETAVDSARMAEVASALFSFLLEYAYEKESAQKAIAGEIKIN